MPAPTIQSQAEVLNERHFFYPIWLERVLGQLSSAAIFIYYLVLFLVNSTVMIVTLGAPYLHYKLYRHDGKNEAQSIERYSQMVKTLDTLWDQWSNFLFHTLPILFPMVSSSGVPLCSIASFVATMTFIVGAISAGTRIIFKTKAQALHGEQVINEWLKASQGPWNKVPNKSFWILFSLPTVVFLLSIGLFISTVVLTFWERQIVGETPSLATPGCTIKRLQAFKYAFFTMLVATVSHFAFVVVKLHFLTAFQNTETSSAV